MRLRSQSREALPRLTPPSRASRAPPPRDKLGEDLWVFGLSKLEEELLGFHPNQAPLDFALAYSYNTAMTESPDAETPPPAPPTASGIAPEVGASQAAVPAEKAPDSAAWDAGAVQGGDAGTAQESDAGAAQEGIEAPALIPLASGYRTVIRIQMILTVLPLAVGASVLAFIFDDLLWRGPLLGAFVGLLLASVLLMPARRFARWGYQLDAERLRVVRGYWFHVDTIVPFVRVQHIDVSQGPVERLCGVSTLTVHTAGTFNSVVDLPGLEPERAAAMRDAIRDRIRSDNE